MATVPTKNEQPPTGERASSASDDGGRPSDAKGPAPQPRATPHHPDEPPDESPVESLGRAIGEVVTGSDEEDIDPRRPKR